MMKIYAYEVRKDEIEYFKKLQDEFQIEIVLNSSILTVNEIIKIDDCLGITTLGQSHINDELLRALNDRNIHYLSTRTIGYNHVDLDSAKKYNIHICRADYAPNGVADYTVMLMLLVLRNYKPALWRGQVNDFSLDGLRGKELRNLCVGIIGTGRIGATVIKNLSGFGCKILAYDPYQNKSILDLVTYTDIEAIYKECDIISLHTPLTKDNYHMINEESINKMKDGVILINCARGELMNINDLIDGIESRKIGGLGLDTIENEEVIIHLDRRTDIFNNRDIAYLKQFPNVVYSQHMAFYTDEAVYSMVRCGIEGILEMAKTNTYRTKIG